MHADLYEAPKGAICVVGSLNADLIVYRSNQGSSGPYDVGDAFELGLGGKGFNVALSLASLGLETYLVGRLGTDVFGNLMQRKLAKTPVREDLVRVDPDNPTGIGHVRVNTDDGDYDTCVVPGANGKVDHTDIDAALASRKDFTHLVLEFEVPVQTALYAAKKARERGIIVVLNASPALRGASELLPYTDVLVVNESEAHALWLEIDGGNARIPVQLWDVIDNLRKTHGTRDVVVTLGSRGLWGMNSLGELRQLAAHDIDIVNAVGAGDSFLAMLVAEMARGISLLASLDMANAAGALACTRRQSWLEAMDAPAIEQLVEDQSVIITPRARRAAR
jgi:ribokinase